MIRTYFHGTSADNLNSILENGLSASEIKLWNCSQDAVYLWEVERVAESNGHEEEEEEYKIQMAFKNAAESGQLACAASKDCRVVVLRIELDDQEVEIDNSCENMDYANCIYRDVTIDEIKEIHVSNDLSLLKGYFIGCLLSNDYCDLEFTDIERRVGEAMAQNIYLEHVTDMIEFEQLQLSEIV